MSKTTQDRGGFTCACVQFDVRRGDVDHNRKKAISGIRAAAEADARLVVLPEMWPTSFFKEAPDALIEASLDAEAAVADLAREHRLVIVGGGIEAEGDRLFNRAQVIDNGEVRGAYRKIHLFTPNAENRHFSPGQDPLIVDTELGRLGVLLCYDIRFPELVRYYFAQDVEILAVPAQWPEARSEHWRTLLRARAIENEMFVAGCNRTGAESSLKNEETLHFPGDSRIIDPMGEAMGSGAGEDGPVVGEIELRKVRTMNRILPIRKDRRPDVYGQIWGTNWDGGTTGQTP